MKSHFRIVKRTITTTYSDTLIVAQKNKYFFSKAIKHMNEKTKSGVQHQSSYNKV